MDAPETANVTICAFYAVDKRKMHNKRIKIGMKERIRDKTNRKAATK